MHRENYWNTFTRLVIGLQAERRRTQDRQVAQRVDSTTVLGGDPDVCPEDDGEFGSATYEGTDVEWSAFAQ